MTKYFVDGAGNYIGGFDGAEPPAGAIEVPSAPAHASDTWVNGQWVFAASPVQPRHITVLAFRNRFTQVEKIGMDLASIDNPSASTAARQQAAAIRVNMADAAAATYIDLDRPDTRAGVQALEAAGVLAAGRAVAILDAPVLDAERPRS